jgi:hypothetical protein
MKSGDRVFFFTLVDFLLQVFFFGLLLFAVSEVAQRAERQSRDEDAAAIERLKKASGVSNIAELTDEMSRLGPIDKLRGTKEFIDRNGGVDEILRAKQFVDVNGGAHSVSEKLEKLAKLEAAYGKPPCLYDGDGGARRPRMIATAVVFDDKIQIQDMTDDFKALLPPLRLTAETAAELPLDAFRRSFYPLVTAKPDCRYFVRQDVRTKYLEPMRTLWAAFRTP